MKVKNGFLKHQIGLLLASSLLTSIAYTEPNCSNIQDYLDCSSEGRAVDIVFVFDTTGSMGEEIRQMQDAVVGFSDTIAAAGIDYNLGLTEFRDFPKVPCGESIDQPYTIYNSGTLTANAEEMKNWIESLVAFGGNDTPESTLAALVHTADEQQWRSDSRKMVVIISDAFPHPDGSSCNEEGNTFDGVISKLKTEGIIAHIIGPEEDSMRRIASETGGAFFEIRSTADISSILDEIATLITCTYKQKSEFLYKESEHSLNISVKLIGAEEKIIPHIEGETKLTTTVCRGSMPCSDFELIPTAGSEGTYYTKTVDISAFENPVELSEFFTLIESCGRSTTTPKVQHHLGSCQSGVTPTPQTPELSVFVDGLDAGAIWTYAPYATSYTFLYAFSPYRDGDSIFTIPMGSQRSIGGTLASGTQLLTAIIAENCSGYSDYSNIEPVNIE